MTCLHVVNPGAMLESYDWSQQKTGGSGGAKAPTSRLFRPTAASQAKVRPCKMLSPFCLPAPAKINEDFNYF